MRVIADIAHTGLVSLLLHPLPNIVTLVCLLIVLVPYLAGMGISQGLQMDAEISVYSGADLYVSGQQFGRAAAIPVAVAERIRVMDGVEKVTPRIVGHVTLGSNFEDAVVVGMPGESLPPSLECIDGRVFSNGRKPELVIGSGLARRLKLKVGDRIPPFYHSSQGERVSEVVGIFRSQVAMWEAQLIFTSFETAAQIFDQSGQATDLLVDCRDGYEASVSRQIRQHLVLAELGSPPGVRQRVITRQQLAAVVPRGLLHRDGIFNLHFLLACVAGALVILVTSGFGLSERRREIGILKAVGWQTDEVLLRSLVESLLVSLFGAALAFVLAYVWLRGLNGYWLASILLAGVDISPEFTVPVRMMPMPAVLACIFSFVMVMSGTLYSTWRAATVSPREAMR